jgi:Uma2 family endonuclease
MTPAIPAAPPATPQPPIMTADEFLKLHGDESGVELVKGRVVRYPMPGAEHGEVCGKANYYLTRYGIEQQTGRVMSNDTFIRVASNPDSFRGADVCFISYQRLPKDQPLPKGPLESAPDLVVEVRSPTDRWGDIQIKVGEYLNAGVSVVIVLDPRTESASVHRQDELHQLLHNGDVLTLPDILPGFSVPVARLFSPE